MTTRVKVDDSALRKEIERNPEMKRTQFEVAEEIMARAKAATPPHVHDRKVRNKKGQLVVPTPMAETFRVAEYRNYVRVGSTAKLYHLLEYGSANNRAYAPIRRAVQSLGEHGIHFRETPKGKR
jgi:hypothetical protein